LFFANIAFAVVFNRFVLVKTKNEKSFVKLPIAMRGGGGRSPYAAPPPVDPDEERRRQVRTVFILLGDYSQRSDDSPSSLAENAVALVSALEEHMQVMTGGKSASEFAELLVQAACNLGMQAPVYALMTALCAAKGKPEGDEWGSLLDAWW
jgi:hypothetical protein